MRRILGNNRGMALVFALTIIILIVAIIKDIAFDSLVEYSVSNRSYQQLKAYYAAKMGAELSLLRLNIYRKAQAQFGAQLGKNQTMLDPLWQMPFAWPPPLPDDIKRVDKEAILKDVKQSIVDTQYFATIESEGAKIDINDLASPVKALATATRKQLLQVLASQIESNEAFSDRYRSFDFEQLLNNIADWIDADSEGRNGRGDESSIYRDQTEIKLPPNRPFKTIRELHMVANMSDEIYDVLAPRITVYGSKGITVNHASNEILMSLDPQISEEVVKDIRERIETPELGGPFKDVDDFKSFLESRGVNYSNIETSGIPLIFDAEFNFRIRSTGQYKNATSEIVAIVYDFDKVKKRLVDFLKKQKEEEDKASQATTKPGEPPAEEADPAAKEKAAQGNDGSSPESKITVPEGRPNVVYWVETS